MKILIVEDEQIILKRIARLTTEILGSRIASLDTVGSLSAAFEFLENNSIDLLMLDLNLNGKDGFEVLDKMTSREFHTIIISAYEERAVTAFEHGVLDFVPKPFDRSRLAKALGRFLDKDYRPGASAKKLFVRIRGTVKVVTVTDINYIKGSGTYSELVLHDGTKFLHAKSMDKLLSLLPLSFVRVHKSYIVDQGQINRIIISRGGQYKIELKSKQVIAMGRTYYQDLVKSGGLAAE